MAETLPSERPRVGRAAAGVDLVRVVFQLLALGALIATSFWIVQPFLAAALWAVTIAVATWPLLQNVEARLGGRHRLAAAVMTLALVMLLVAPLYVAIATLVRHALRIGEWSQTLTTLTVPAPPGWLAGIPLVGGPLTGRWHELAAASPEELAARVQPYARTAAVWFAGQVGGFGVLLLQMLLTVVIAALLYADGERAAASACRFARRLAGPRGEAALRLAAQAVRAVALGVVGTAVVQAGLGGLGLAVVGVPFAAVATAAMFVLAIAQIGAAPVLLAAVVWVYLEKGAGWGSAFLVWGRGLQPPRQRAPAPSHPARRGPAPAADLRRRDRRADRVRRDRALHRAGGARRRLHASRGLGYRGADANLKGRTAAIRRVDRSTQTRPTEV